MDPIDYEAEYARLLAEIDDLPPEQQESLRAMHAESVRRHEEIQESSRQSREAMGELTDKLRVMAEDFQRLDVALGDLRLVAKMALFDLEARRREQIEADDDTPSDDDPAPGHD